MELAAGILAVILSNLVSHMPLDRWLGLGSESILTDVVFESGVALMGAAIAAYFMGVRLNREQKNAKAFRKEIHRKLREQG